MTFFCSQDLWDIIKERFIILELLL